MTFSAAYCWKFIWINLFVLLFVSLLHVNTFSLFFSQQDVVLNCVTLKHEGIQSIRLFCVKLALLPQVLCICAASWQVLQYNYYRLAYNSQHPVQTLITAHTTAWCMHTFFINPVFKLTLSDNVAIVWNTTFTYRRRRSGYLVKHRAFMPRVKKRFFSKLQP